MGYIYIYIYIYTYIYIYIRIYIYIYVYIYIYIYHVGQLTRVFLTFSLSHSLSLSLSLFVPMCVCVCGTKCGFVKSSSSCAINHGYPWPSLTTLPYRPLFSADPQGYIPYRHRAAVCRFKLVVLPLHVHRSTSLMSSSLLLQQCPACLIRLILIGFVMGGSWPYSCCLVGCCLQDLFNRYWEKFKK